MATSNSYDFSVTRNDIILRALQRLNILDIADSAIPTEYLNLSILHLNAMIKSWRAEGLKLWKRKEGYLFLANNDRQYNLGPSGDHATKSYSYTQVATAALSGATILILDSTTGMTNGDFIGIELDSGSRQWTTISTVDSSTQVTIAASLTGNVAIDNTVVAYTTKIQRPLKISYMSCMNLTESIETELRELRYEDYQRISDKTTLSSHINSYNYDPQLNNGVLRIWPTPNDVKYVLKFVFHEPLEDFDNPADNPDFPIEWTLALISNLAVKLAPFIGAYPELEALKMEAMEEKMACMLFDTDNEPFSVYPRKR